MEQHSNFMNSGSSKLIYLIAGATGTVGSEVVKALLSAGSHVRALTRNPSKTNFPDSVEVIPGDLESPASFKEALKDVVGIHLTTFTGQDYQPLQTGAEIVTMAEEAGVKRVTVLWSGEGKKSPVEQAVEKSNLEWTILQPQEFMANALTWKHSIKDQGVVAEPFAARPTAAVHEADIGAVAASILIQGGHARQAYTLTGPEVLTPQRQVAIINEVLNKQLKFKELTVEDAVNRWKQSGFSDELINYLFAWYKNPPPEAYTVVPTVEKLIGRPAKSFSEWVHEHAHIFS